MNLHEVLLASRMAGKNNSNGENVDLSDYYTKSQTNGLISEKVAEIVANAPEDFDTLKEISDWIESHEDSAAAMNSAILANTTAITTKVDKVSGKGLSANDFTNADKIKLESLENYDDANVKADVAETAEQTALNRSTLGYQRKNVLQNNCKNTTKNGITATVNDDGSITLTGSNTLGSAFVLYVNVQTGAAGGISGQYIDNRKFIPNGRYIVSGGTASANVQVRWSEDNAADNDLAVSQNGNEVLFSVTDTHKYVWSRILIKSGADFSTPVTVYPMIRPAEITDSTYEPYRPSVAEYIASLEERIAALEPVNLTANSLNSSLNTAEINAIEEEFNND